MEGERRVGCFVPAAARHLHTYTSAVSPSRKVPDGWEGPRTTRRPERRERRSVGLDDGHKTPGRVGSGGSGVRKGGGGGKAPELRRRRRWASLSRARATHRRCLRWSRARAGPAHGTPRDAGADHAEEGGSSRTTGERQKARAGGAGGPGAAGGTGPAAPARSPLWISLRPPGPNSPPPFLALAVLPLCAQYVYI
eukprot:scaffold1518_cov417-Prasinococcus_capsulatus_cf.AAC.8